MNPNLKLVYDSTQNNTPEPPKENSGVDIDAFITPDADFESRVAQVQPAYIPSTVVKDQEFPDFNLADFQIESIEETQPVSKEVSHFKQRFEWVCSGFPEIMIDNDLMETTQNAQKNHDDISLQSVLESHSPFYARRFQEVLALYPTISPENTVKRYAKILLYMMEQFHVHSEKSHQHKFMLNLKKVLWEQLDRGEEKDYIETIKRRAYIRPTWELKDEIEFLYQVYYDCYIQAQKEYHIYLRAEDIALRKRLQKQITSLEQEMIPHFDPDAPGYDARNLPQHILKQRLLQKRAQNKSDKN